MNVPFISFDAADRLLDWLDLAAEIVAGHNLPKAEMADVVLKQGNRTILSRHAWIDGLGALVKTGVIHPDNMKISGTANLNGLTSVFRDDTGEPEATLDFHLVTKWKTAADSLLAAQRLARADCRKILILGAGPVALSLVQAYRASFPDAQFKIWNRTATKADELVRLIPNHDIQAVNDLPAATKTADIIACATMSNTPVIKGAWLRPGQHIELIGAYLPDMREADDLATQRSRIFVDSFDTTVDHIGELIDPIKSGAIRRSDILGDFYDLKSGKFARKSDDEITLHKNGGGAHLDLMTSRYILKVCT